MNAVIYDSGNAIVGRSLMLLPIINGPYPRCRSTLTDISNNNKYELEMHKTKKLTAGKVAGKILVVLLSVLMVCVAARGRVVRRPPTNRP